MPRKANTTQKKTAKKQAAKKSATKKPRRTKDKTAAQIHKLLLRNLQDRVEAGERLNEAELARLEALIPAPKNKPTVIDPDELLGPYVWANRNAAAADFDVSPTTISNWCSTLNIDCNRKAIIKHELYRALWQRAEREKQAEKSEADRKEQDLRIQERQARVNKRTGALNIEANDRAVATIARLGSELFSDLENEFPAELTDAINQANTTDAIELQQIFHRLIKNKRATYMQRCGQKINQPTNEKTPDQQQSIALDAESEQEKQQ